MQPESGNIFIEQQYRMAEAMPNPDSRAASPMRRRIAVRSRPKAWITRNRRWHHARFEGDGDSKNAAHT